MAEKADFVCPPHLPPRDAWKVNPDTLRRFYAPTDDRGFVLPDATVEVVKSLFEDDYEWPIDRRRQETAPDIHHFHWIARQYTPVAYSSRYTPTTIPNKFRELPSVKGLVPRQFHNVIHKVTLPPRQPRHADMARHVEAYEIAKRLFTSAANASTVQRQITSRLDANIDEVAHEILVDRLRRQFEGYNKNMELLIGAAGLQLLALDDPKFKRRKPREVAQLLGRVVRIKEADYVPQFKPVAA